MYKNFFKRVIDFIIVLTALLIIWPILLVIYIWLTIANKGAGAIFFQERPGKDEKIFKVMKFKSMSDERDSNGNLLPDAQRLTKVGAFVQGVFRSNVAFLGVPFATSLFGDEGGTMAAIILAAVVAAGCLFRVLEFDTRSLEYDEIWTMTHYFKCSFSEIFTELETPNNHPLHTFIAQKITSAHTKDINFFIFYILFNHFYFSNATD